MIDAQAEEGYELEGQSQFTFTFTDIRLVTATAPTFTDEFGTADDTYTIPSVEGVTYVVDGSAVASGTYPGSGTVQVTAVAQPGYVLEGTSGFTFTFTDIRLVTATAPTFTDEYGTADDTYTIPDVEGVTYVVDGAPVAPGTYPGSGTIQVTAVAQPGYVLDGASGFTFTFTDIRLVTATAPTFTDRPGTADDTVTIPDVTGVVYRLDGTPLAPGTHALTGTLVITAHPRDAGYELTGTTEFPDALAARPPW